MFDLLDKKWGQKTTHTFYAKFIHNLKLCNVSFMIVSYTKN